MRPQDLVPTRAWAGRLKGVALLEALVALLIMAFGMVALVGLQSSLRRGSDLSKQRGEAIRLAQQQMETLRSYSLLTHPDPANPAAGVMAFSDIQTMEPNADAGDANSNATFMLSRTVTDTPAGISALASVRIRVDWKDRTEGAQFVLLDSFIAAADPSLSGSLGIAPASFTTQRPGGREASIPLLAKDLGDGRSAFAPSPVDTVAFVFNNLTGTISSKCSVAMGKPNAEIVATDLINCQSTFAYLLSGTVSFALSTPPYPGQPALASLPFALRLANSPQKPPGAVPPPAPAHECYPLGLNPSTVKRIDFHCIVYPNAENNTTWSARLILRNLADEVPAPAKPVDLLASQLVLRSPAQPPSSPNELNIPITVCRYSADYSGDRKIDNSEHPLDYARVNGPLLRQNFLVLSASANCPIGSAIDPTQGIFSNNATALHQPLGSETPIAQ
ncbi:type IV pilus modification PilV family protein [Roseateles sp.]|uniref:type IV pilus modification PilV family protein n=1 Tax=Roseateles sp. TaxID=1971397 RepID=UPI003BA554B6